MGEVQDVADLPEQRAVALARALVAKPDLILADEPTGNVDPVMAERIMKLFIELNKLGSAVVVATHDLGLVKHLGKPTISLKQGRLINTNHMVNKTSNNIAAAEFDDDENWLDQGGKTSTERASVIWQKLLEEYQAPPLDGAIKDELNAYVSTRKEALGTNEP